MWKKCGNKILQSNLKANRIRWQIEHLEKELKEYRNMSIVSNLMNAIERRKKAVEYLQSSGNLTWEEIRKRFGFDYFNYYTMNRKIKNEQPTTN